MLTRYNELKDTIDEEALEQNQSLNEGNQWLNHLQGGPQNKPYLKVEGRLKKKPKVIHVSARQRRAYSNGK
jgi:hypothetical protein